MGWFIGITGHVHSLKSEIKSLYPKDACQIENDDLFLAGGGLDQTFYCNKKQNPESGWMASGIGISKIPDPFIYDISDWENSIQKGAEYLHSINGHFAVVKWHHQNVELITDQLGIRNIFICKRKDFVLFSTRLDWILKLIPETKIDWKNFGSRWLAINQFSSKSFIENVERISQGGKAEIYLQNVSITNKRWAIPQHHTTSTEDFKQSLLSFSTLPLKAGRQLSLGLSGGLDSRTIFACLLQIADQPWALHTFGEKEHPDLYTAERLNKPFGRPHHIFHEEIPDSSTLIKLIPDYIGQTLFTATPSHLIGFQSYQKINELKLNIIDGAFGEIARRRFMVSILLRAKKTVIEKNADALLPYLKLHRADIFEKACEHEMLIGFREELDTELQAMPDAKDIGLENWLDLFTIRTRVHNTAGPEQARSDSILFNYMPFLQPELTGMAINLPLRERKNAQIFRDIIRNSAPQLQKMPLVKGSVTYPYWMKDISSAFWMRMKKKTGKEFHSSLQVELLLQIEDYVRDLFNSQSAREFPQYDQRKIHRLISGFYDEGNHALANDLNWCLAFEVFRRL